jgi:hypothetical protein
MRHPREGAASILPRRPDLRWQFGMPQEPANAFVGVMAAE